MFFFIPWKVDVPQDRWPVVNWLILLALVAVFVLQVAGVAASYADRRGAATEDLQPGRPAQTTVGDRRTDDRPQNITQGVQPGPAPSSELRARSSENSSQRQEIPGITGRLMLRGWSLTELFGYMWLHGGLLHLFGNLLFLWIFGNAVCAKIGSLRYLLLYVFFGVAAGIVHLVAHGGAVLGASGAISGVVGMYLVLFYQNDITCVFAAWLILPYIRVFAVSSIWIILLWLAWNTLGALIPGGSHVAYFAHLGGFAAGFAIALLMCYKGWITMERYERSLLQMWQERRQGRPTESLDAAYAQLGLQVPDEPGSSEEPARAAAPELPPIPLPPVESGAVARRRGPAGSIRTACACGHVIQVTRQYAGRTVRCPSCRQPMVIPEHSEFFGPAPQPVPGTALLNRAQDDLIRFLCTCGRRIKVPARYAGRTCRCPQCGTQLRIPPASTRRRPA
jgi:membrane associated rhomboid family serine protease